MLALKPTVLTISAEDLKQFHLSSTGKRAKDLQKDGKKSKDKERAEFIHQ